MILVSPIRQYIMKKVLYLRGEELLLFSRLFMVYQWWSVLTFKAKKGRAVYWYARMGDTSGETRKKVYYMRMCVCARVCERVSKREGEKGIVKRKISKLFNHDVIIDWLGVLLAR